MKKIYATILSFLFLTGIYATEKVIDSIPVNPGDVESVDAIINSLYNVISGPAGEKTN